MSAGSAVASGAADLLVVGLDRRRHVGMDDEAHVRLVDAHAEGDGGARRRRRPPAGRRPGCGCARLLHARRGRRSARCPSRARHSASFSVLVARGGVDDAALALAVASRKSRDLLARLVLGGEGEVEVGPVEAMQEDLRRLRSKSCAAMSARVCVVGGGGEAPMAGTPPSASRARRAARYSGRKSWPHWETQCASSIASRVTSMRRRRRTRPSHGEALGRDEQQSQRAVVEPVPGCAVSSSLLPS